MAQFCLLSYGEKLLGTSEGVIRLNVSQLSGLQIEAQFPIGDWQDDSYELCILAEPFIYDDADDSVGLRTLLSEVRSEEEYVLLARAAQVASWYASFVYCPRCATELICHENELAKICTHCDHHQYPRISPCIIVLVRKGDKCLLAHASRFASGRYSTLAGFIEAGESAESAVEREVKEEVGIAITNVEYCFSQSWPFPHSLMLGYLADYKSGDIVPDGEEILLADWFDADNLPVLPPHFTIARRLIDKFLREQGENIEDGESAFFGDD